MHKVFLSPHAERDKQRLRNDIEDAVDNTLDELARVVDFRRDLHKPLEFEPAKLRRARPAVLGSDYRIIWHEGKNAKREVLAIWRRDNNTYTHARLKRLLRRLPSDDWTEWIPTADTATVLHSEACTQETDRFIHPTLLGTQRILDNIVELTPSQKAIVQLNATGPVLIRGVAGSGKTALGLHRARHIARLRAKLGKSTSILILTRTRALKTGIGWLFANSFTDLPNDIQIGAFGDWMKELLNQRNPTVSAIDNAIRKEHIRHIRTELSDSHPEGVALRKMTSSFILGEIDDVIRGRNIGSLQDYTKLKRFGRRKSLNQLRRELIWIVYQNYVQVLREQSLFDWAELPQLVMDHCRPLPQFDVVIVDEAQDMRPNYLVLATKLVKDFSEHRSVTLLGDSAQSIQYQGVSWRDAKILLRGRRVRVLRNNHRNTQQIISAALPILDKCRHIGSVHRYHSPESISKDGDKPVLVQYTHENRAVKYISQEIHRLSKRSNLNLDFSNFAILSPRIREKSELFQALWRDLPRLDIPCLHFRDEDFMAENEVGLVTMQSATGLEFPVVFVIDFEEGTIPYRGPSSTPAEDIEERGRRLAYVSMTRASERLYLVYRKSNPSCFISDILQSDKDAVEIVDLQ